MSCLTLQWQVCAHLCLLCVSAHRLRDLLSSLQICKRVVHDILKKVLAICETVFTFLCDQCPNCRTVVSLAMVSAHRLSHLLSTLRICKRVVQDIPKKLSWICGTVVTFWCAHCPNCKTVVSLSRSLTAAALKLWGLAPEPYVSYTFLSLIHI